MKSELLKAFRGFEAIVKLIHVLVAGPQLTRPKSQVMSPTGPTPKGKLPLFTAVVTKWRITKLEETYST